MSLDGARSYTMNCIDSDTIEAHHANLTVRSFSTFNRSLLTDHYGQVQRITLAH